MPARSVADPETANGRDDFGQARWDASNASTRDRPRTRGDEGHRTTS